MSLQKEKCCEKCYDLSISDDTRTCFIEDCSCHSLQKESEWEKEWDDKFLEFYSATSALPEKHKAFISEVRENAYREGWKMGEKNIVGIYQGKDMKEVVATAVSQREKEIAEEAPNARHECARWILTDGKDAGPLQRKSKKEEITLQLLKHSSQ